MTSTEVNSGAEGLPQLQSVQRVMALPTVGLAVEQVGAIYSRVKEVNSLFNWALSIAENTVSAVAQGASPYVAAPLAAADTRLAAALGELERRLPLVTEQPEVILDTAKDAITSRVSPQVEKVCAVRNMAQNKVDSLTELSWAKANELLNKPYGQKALSGVDSSVALAHRLLDYYLPPQEGESEESIEVDVVNDPALHTLRTVEKLSTVAAERLWKTLSHRLATLSTVDLDPRRYLSALLAVAHLAQLTQAVAPAVPETSEATPSVDTPVASNTTPSPTTPVTPKTAASSKTPTTPKVPAPAPSSSAKPVKP